MTDKKKPRFFDLEEHTDGDNSVWEPVLSDKPAGNLGGFVHKVVIYTFLLGILAGSGFYIFYHLMNRGQISPGDSFSPLTGKVREEKRPQPVEVKEPRPEFIEKKVKKIIRQDREVTVKRGDTFLGILNYFYNGYDKALRKKVRAANPRIKNFSSLRIGQELLLPDVEEEVEIIEKIPVKPKDSAPAPKQGVMITEFNGERSDYWFYVKGSIINNTSRDLDFIKVNVDYLDDERNVISSDSTYAVGEKALKVGENKDFLIMSRVKPGVTNFELYLDYY